jgi:hypothetical protein
MMTSLLRQNHTSSNPVQSCGSKPHKACGGTHISTYTISAHLITSKLPVLLVMPPLRLPHKTLSHLECSRNDQQWFKLPPVVLVLTSLYILQLKESHMMEIPKGPLILAMMSPLIVILMETQESEWLKQEEWDFNDGEGINLLDSNENSQECIPLVNKRYCI